MLTNMATQKHLIPTTPEPNSSLKDTHRMPELLGVPEAGKAGKNPREQSAGKQSTAAASVIAAPEKWDDGVVSPLGGRTGQNAIQTALLHFLVHVGVLPLVEAPKENDVRI